MKSFSKSLLLLIWFFVLPFFANETWAESCSSQQCHADIVQYDVMHSPAQEGECTACHESRENTHPSGNGSDFALTADGASLCFQCHEQENFVGKVMHGPSASGACTYCHNPHGSKNMKLLRKPPQEMCFDCHTDFLQDLKKATYVHSAIRDLNCVVCHLPHKSERLSLLKAETTELCFSCHENIKDKYERSLNKHKALYVDEKCANCHSVHFSERPSLLNKDGVELCLECHGRDEKGSSDSLRNMRKEIEGKKFLHGPVADGDCIACHDPHGSSYDLILKDRYPTSFYLPFDKDAYDLCFGCHNKGMLTQQKTADQTAFRNGKENLHFLHVVKERKGRTCKACHSVHASDGEKLINPDGIPFGDWKIPIRYTATETGGSCAPGCHRQMYYDREKPVDNAEEIQSGK